MQPSRPVPTPPADPAAAWASVSMHLPRALYAFRAAGFDACPLPSRSDYVPMKGIGWFLPQRSALAKSEAALHEMVGAIVYALRSTRSS